VEATAGGASAQATSKKMANISAASTRLQQTYTPAQIATAATVPEARLKGRRPRAKNETGS
jgi:hypothetical protein